MEFVTSYLHLILSERQWSWTLVGAGYLIVTLFVRTLIFRKIVREAKAIDLNLYSTVRGLYLKNSSSGWILFSISFLLVIVMWIEGGKSPMEPKLLSSFFFLLLVFFFFSLILHLTAFAQALLAALRQRTGVEKEF